MDPGGLGAIIGISVMIGIFSARKICDVYQRYKQKRNLQRIPGKRIIVPQAVSNVEKSPILPMKRHWKMKDLKLPKSYILHNLTIRKF